MSDQKVYVATRISKETLAALTKKQKRIQRETGTDVTIAAIIRSAIERDVAREERR